MGENTVVGPGLRSWPPQILTLCLGQRKPPSLGASASSFAKTRGLWFTLLYGCKDDAWRRTLGKV